MSFSSATCPPSRVCHSRIAENCQISVPQFSATKLKLSLCGNASPRAGGELQLSSASATTVWCQDGDGKGERRRVATATFQKSRHRAIRRWTRIAGPAWAAGLRGKDEDTGPRRQSEAVAARGCIASYCLCWVAKEQKTHYARTQGKTTSCSGEVSTTSKM